MPKTVFVLCLYSTYFSLVLLNYDFGVYWNLLLNNFFSVNELYS